MGFTDELISFYESDGLEERRFLENAVHRLEFDTASRLLDRHLRPGSKILDNCAGSGAYSFYLAAKGHRVTAADIVPYNVDVMRKKQASEPPLDGILLADCQRMSRFADASFDAVLCMGALYHLPEAADRRQAVAESLRLLAPGGLFACSYMNRYAVIMGNIEGDVENIADILDFTQHGREGIFYASTPEEMQGLLADFPVDLVCHAAMDGMATLLRYFTNKITDMGLENWRRYHAATCEVPSLLGSSYHNLMLFRKRTENLHTERT